MQSRSQPNQFITHVGLHNYRSFKSCNVSLGRLAFLVGPNGSGKSNFLDALRLVRDSLDTSLDHALRERGGLREVIRRGPGSPNMAILLQFNLGAASGEYGLQIAPRLGGDFAVVEEQCSVGGASYRVQAGEVKEMTADVRPPAMKDRLYLTNAAGLPEFRPLYDALRQMGFYNINPSAIRDLQLPDRGDALSRDGRNLAGVIARLKREGSAALERIHEYLGRVVPGLIDVQAKQISTMETLEFLQRFDDSPPLRFPASNMSDGTLRALAVLVSLFQGSKDHKTTLIGIEEPETALHPAAAGILRDCIIEGSTHTQVIVTSHSADLLDSADLPAEQIFSVESNQGNSILSPLNDSTRSILKDRLYTAGELLRNGQLQ